MISTSDEIKVNNCVPSRSPIIDDNNMNTAAASASRRLRVLTSDATSNCSNKTDNAQRIVVNSLLCFVDNFRHRPNIAKLIYEYFDTDAINAAGGVLRSLTNFSEDVENSASKSSRSVVEKFLRLFDLFVINRRNNNATRFVADDLGSLPLALPSGGETKINNDCTTKSITNVYREVYRLRTYLHRYLHLTLNANRASRPLRFSHRSSRALYARQRKSQRNISISTILNNLSGLGDQENTNLTPTPNSQQSSITESCNTVNGEQLMFPNYFSAAHPSNSTPLKSYYQASAPNSLLTPAKCGNENTKTTTNNNGSPINTLMLLAAASSSASSSVVSSPSSHINASSCKISPTSSLAKKRRLYSTFHSNSNAGATFGAGNSGNRLDRAVRKLTNRLEAKIMEPNQTKDNIMAISPTSSTSSTSSSGNKTRAYDSGSYSNCDGISSNESSTQTTPIKRTTSPDGTSVTTAAAATTPLLIYMNGPNNFYKAKLASILHSNTSATQLSSFLQNLSAFTPQTPFSTPNNSVTATTTSVPAASFSSINNIVSQQPQPSAPTGTLDTSNYIKFFKNLATVAALLSNSGASNTLLPLHSIGTSSTPFSEPNSEIADTPTPKRCWTDGEAQNKPSLGCNAANAAASLLTLSAASTPITADEVPPFVNTSNFLSAINNNLPSWRVTSNTQTPPGNAEFNNNNNNNTNNIEEETVEDYHIKFDQSSDDYDTNNNGKKNTKGNNKNNSAAEGGFVEANFDDSTHYDADILKRSPPPSSNDSVDNDSEKPFACTHANCHKRFTNKFLLKKHQFIHTGLRPHACPFCSKRFNRKDNLLRHKKTHLSNGEEEHIVPRRRHNASLLYDVSADAIQVIKNAFPAGAFYSPSAFAGISSSMLTGAAATSDAGRLSLATCKRRTKQDANSITINDASTLNTVHNNIHNNGAKDDEEHCIIDPVTMDEIPHQFN